MRRRLRALLLVPFLLTGCGGPLIVPEAGPNAPGYTEIAAPPAPEVELLKDAGERTLKPGGAVDNVVRRDGSFEVTGWALLDPEKPRGVLQVVIPNGVKADVREAETLMRPDVVTATKDEDLLWAGFSITVDGMLPQDADLCVVSRSSRGTFLLSGSERPCPG